MSTAFPRTRLPAPLPPARPRAQRAPLPAAPHSALHRWAPAAAGAARWLGGSFRRRAFRTFRVRIAVQAFFALACLWVGYRFALFVDAAQAAAPLPARPPGVEGFLPISGLMGTLDWIYSGTLNSVHPAATVLVLVFLATSLLLRKAFCSWICPVGLLSDGLARLGRRAFGRTFRPWGWLDVLLRSLKYLLLGFFLWVILGMDPVALKAFIASPYNRIADVKMYLFFSPPGQITLVVVGVLALVSVAVQGAWCRYLCPYGALLGLFSWASPVKVRRDPSTCTGCGLCDEVCSARLSVSKSLAVGNPECIGCLDCVASCPVRETLTVGTVCRRLSPLAFAGVLLALFASGYGAARLAGCWHNQVPAADYHRLTRHAGSLGHPGM